MRLLGVACAALNQTPLDWEGNASRIVQACNQARALGAQVLCLPELCLTGYGCEDLFFSPHVQRTALELLPTILPATKGLTTGVGLPLYVNGDCYNAVAVLSNGELAGFVVKQHLARQGLYYEPRWFRAWARGLTLEIPVMGQEFPVGDVVFDVHSADGADHFRVGFEICEDAWAPQRPGGRLASCGVDLILNPSASHFAFGRYDIRKRFVLEGSRAFGASYLYANLLGNESGRVIFDGSRLIASGGVLVAEGERFGFDDVEVTATTIDLDAHRLARPRSATQETIEGVRPAVLLDMPRVVSVRGGWSLRSSMTRAKAAPSWERGAAVREEEFTRAMGLGLFDYARKSGQKGFVISLSGGADSATLALLVRYAVQLGGAQLGLAGFVKRFGIAAPVSEALGASKQVLASILTTVYQATRNSSEVTRSAAQKIAEAVSARHLEWNVDAIVDQYTQLVEKGLGRTLSWDRDDLTLQNIQARVRAPGVWMLANIENKLLLSTSNRSEGAVGYATMDGDTAGGLAPLAGINKEFIRSWLRWVESAGPEGCGPLPAVHVVNIQDPTAELRPPSRGAAKQTDEADLMPYEILDSIERCVVDEGKSPEEVLLSLAEKVDGRFTEQQLRLWVVRFFQLFSRNQWKRERFAPSFHLDAHSLDPKSWFRFPILSAGFAFELSSFRRSGPQ